MAKAKKIVLQNASFVSWLLALFLILVFAIGGSSRADVQSLLILRPTAVIICGWALWHIETDQIRLNKPLLIGGLIAIAFVGIYIIPLPDWIFPFRPEYGLIIEIDKLAELQNSTRPISIHPLLTLEALFALSVPLAVLLLLVQLQSGDRLFLLQVLVALIVVSGLFGFLQSLNGPDSPLYLYRTTNHGFAVGLYANRNHQATLLACLFPMIAVVAVMRGKLDPRARARAITAFTIGILLVPLLLVTGSRAGIVFGIFGMVAAAILYRGSRDQSMPKPSSGSQVYLPWVAGFLILAVGLITVLLSRAEAVRRLADPAHSDDIRFEVWPSIANMALDYLPSGTGVGTFPSIFQLNEPTNILRTGYLNQAHNDFLDLLVTTGYFGVFFAIIFLGFIASKAIAAFRSHQTSKADTLYRRLGAVLVSIFLAASSVDYPLRVPSAACLFVVALMWLAGNPKQFTEKAGTV